MTADAELDAGLRAKVFADFLREGSPPPVEQLMLELQLPRSDVEGALDRLDAAHHLKLVPGTHRILMAFPFSAIATPYRVSLPGGRKYFANCAWDSIAFHPMLREPTHVESFCHHCGRPIAFDLREGRPVNGDAAPVVYLGLPAVDWWKDIVFTCANTMLFFSSSSHLSDWRSSRPAEHGVELTVELVLGLSEPIYAGRMELGYQRPSRDRLATLFHDLGLEGEFWRV